MTDKEQLTQYLTSSNCKFINYVYGSLKDWATKGKVVGEHWSYPSEIGSGKVFEGIEQLLKELNTPMYISSVGGKSFILYYGE